jgi:hypothetical protein
MYMADDETSNDGPLVCVNHVEEPYWIETAWNWFQRSQKSKIIIPKDPTTAAQAFMKGHVSTGIPFIDRALQTSTNTSQAPFLELLGPVYNHTNKTNKNKTTTMTIDTSTCSCSPASWTLISLAARFVVATRPSKYQTWTTTHTVTWNVVEEDGGDDDHDDDEYHHQQPRRQQQQSSLPLAPNVILIDSFHSIDIHDLVSAVRGLLLLDSVEDESLDMELEDCLARIHILFLSDTIPIVAGLEALRCKFLPSQQQQQQQNDDNDANGNTAMVAAAAVVANVPNLLLWDNFLTTIPDKTEKREIIRQLLRLWRDTTNTMVVVSTIRGYSELDDKHAVTCRIRLETATATAVCENEQDPHHHYQQQQQQQHWYIATLLGSSTASQEPVSFTIGTVGILA